jgi:hypothetical protein
VVNELKAIFKFFAKWKLQSIPGTHAAIFQLNLAADLVVITYHW